MRTHIVIISQKKLICSYIYSDACKRNSQRIIARLKREGFELVSAKGSHHKLRKGTQNVHRPASQEGFAGRHRACNRKAGRIGCEVEPMKYFIALVHKDNDSAFGISFPDLPSVFSAADIEDDLTANAIEAIRPWAEEEALPIPSSYNDLMSRDDVRAELARGAFLTHIPFIADDTRTVRANVTFDKGMLDAIDATAKERGLTRSAFLASAARKEIEAA
jgi:predicted RNase H-like HicB family nuclease